jgi:hypothetical protein
MKLETQVVSLELAKRLRELGVKQESYFYWSESTIDGVHNQVNHMEPTTMLPHWYSAHTVAELGQFLPNYVSLNEMDGNRYFYSCKQDEEWEVGYDSPQGSLGLQFAEGEADARAKLLIYLIENKLITL